MTAFDEVSFVFCLDIKFISDLELRRHQQNQFCKWLRY